MQMRRLMLPCLALAASVVVGACGGGGGGSSPAPAPAPTPAPTPSPSPTGNTVIAAATPAGTVKTLVGTQQNVVLTFTTDDQLPASGMSITAGLNALPINWTGPASLSCQNVSTGSGCQLTLAYAPTAPSSGTLSLQYAYVSSKAVAKTGSITVNYAATTHNVVNTTVAIGGSLQTPPVSATIGHPRAVTVTFNTNDINTASALSIGSAALSPLPAGWTTSSAVPFTCAAVAATGTSCQLALTFNPSAVGSGTLALPYSYTDSAGSSMTGNVSFGYVATLDNNVVVTVAPAGSLAVSTYTTTPVTVDFTTDDGQPATGLSITSGLPLPAGAAGWTNSPAFASCSSFSVSGTCTMALSYAPTAAGNGTLTFNYQYTSMPGSGGGTSTTKTGSFQIPYSAIVGHLFVADGGAANGVTTGGNQIARCALDPTSGSLSGCAIEYGPVPNLDPRSIVFSGGYGYVSSHGLSQILACAVNPADATLTASSCASVGPTGGPGVIASPSGLTVVGSSIYVANGGAANVLVCPLNGGGALSCVQAATFSASALAAGAAFQEPTGVAVAGNMAYIVDRYFDGSPPANMPGHTATGSIIVCGYTSSSGALSNCAPASTKLPHPNPLTVTLVGSTILYVGAPSGTSICLLDGAGNLTSCSSTGPYDAVGGTGTDYGISFANGFGYIGDNSGSKSVLVCPAYASSVSGACVQSTGTGIVSPEGSSPL